MIAKAKKSVIDLSLIIVISLLGLGAIEAAVRAYLRLATGNWPSTRAVAFYEVAAGTREIFRPHHYLAGSAREGAEAVIYGRRVTINTLGYRSPERPMKAPREVLRVVCSGGSTTFDFFAEDNEHSWPFLLEEELRKSGAEVEVWNAGLPSWSSLENTISLLIRDIDLEPDVLILYQGINDLRPASFRPFDRQYDKSQGAAVRELLGFNFRSLPWYERFIIVEKIHDLFFQPRRWRDFVAVKESEERLQAILAEGVEVFERNVRTYISIGRARGASVILMTQPIRLREDFSAQDLRHLEAMFPDLAPEATVAEIEKLNDVLRRIAEEGEVVLIDVVKDFAVEDAAFGDPMHFSLRGSKLFAAFIQPVVAQELEKTNQGRTLEPEIQP